MRTDAEYRHHDKIQKIAYLRIDWPKFQEWTAGKDISPGRTGEINGMRRTTRETAGIFARSLEGVHSFIINKTWEGEGFCVRE